MSKLFIRIGQVNRKLVILILIYSVTVIFTELNFFFSSRDTNNIIDFFVSSLGEIFGGILMPYIVKNKTTIKSKKKTSKKQSVKDYFLLFIIFLIAIGTRFLVNISTNNTLQLSILSFLQGWAIILFLILTYFFLKYKYHIHHIISLSIFCISCVLLDIILGHFSNLGLSLLYMFIYVSFDVASAIYLKYLMDYKYKQYWNILLAIGFFC